MFVLKIPRPCTQKSAPTVMPRTAAATPLWHRTSLEAHQGHERRGHLQFHRSWHAAQGISSRLPAHGINRRADPGPIHEAFASYFLFEDHMSKTFKEVLRELFDTFSDPQKRDRWSAEEYKKEHKRRLRELKVRVDELYLKFGLRPPRSRWT